MSNYATFKRGGRRRICWASQLPKANDRLNDAVKLGGGKYFAAQVLFAMPGGEMLAVEVCERGRRLVVKGKAREVTVPAGVFWKLAEAARKAQRADGIGGESWLTS